MDTLILFQIRNLHRKANQILHCNKITKKVENGFYNFCENENHDRESRIFNQSKNLFSQARFNL